MTEELSESYVELVKYIISKVLDELEEQIKKEATIVQVTVTLVTSKGEKGTVVANLVGDEKGGTA